MQHTGVRVGGPARAFAAMAVWSSNEAMDGGAGEGLGFDHGAAHNLD
jgi:hypothetical protein